MYDAEVNNGHWQYFMNSSGDNWKSTIDGLTEIVAQDRAEILQEATSLFGVDGPSLENDTRHHQLAKFSKRKDQMLSELDNRYNSCDESIEVLIALYVIKHKDHFTAKE